MVRKLLLYLCCLVFFVIPSPAHAGTKRAYAEVDPRSGTVDDSYTLRVIVENGEVDSPPEFQASSDFEIQTSWHREWHVHN